MPYENTAKVLAHVAPELRKALDRMAFENGTSLSELVRTILNDYVSDCAAKELSQEKLDYEARLARESEHNPFADYRARSTDRKRPAPDVQQ